MSGNALKIIAIVCMAVDHVAWVFFPGDNMEPLTIVMHVIGRTTAPIMIFFISEGYHYTRNRKKYLGRLLLFSAISQIPYLMIFSDMVVIPGIPTMNVIWPFAMGVLALMVDQGDILPDIKPWQRVVLTWVFIALALPSSWSMPAALAIFFMGRQWGNIKGQMITMAQFLAIYAVICGFLFNLTFGLIHIGVVIPILLLAFLYNGTRGTVGGNAMKWLFYIFYPAHLLLLGLITIYCGDGAFVSPGIVGSLFILASLVSAIAIFIFEKKRVAGE